MILKPSGESKRFISKTRDGVHAEKHVLTEISEWLEKNRPEQKAISLTTTATKSPCLDCQPEILDMLKKWREKLKLTVSYKLRISSLYHDSAPTLTKPKKRLSDREV